MPHRNQITRRSFTVGAASFATAPLLVGTARAQAGWPAARPITLLVGYPPGGSTDFVARTIAEPLSRRLGTPVVVENVGGAGGTIAAQRAVNAAPDGYTLLLGSGSEVSLARLFNTAVKYDGRTDLSHIGLVGVTPMVLVASAALGIKNLDDALARVKKEPKRYSFASAGVGTPLHMAGELVNLKAGIGLRHIPYRGAGQMVQDVLGGSTDFGVFVLTSALPHIRSGKMTALGVTTAGRSRAAPEIPALGEHPRLKGYDMNVWFGLFGPARLPAPMVARLNRELNQILREKQTWEKLQKAGISNDGGTPEALTAFVKAETERVRGIVNQAVAAGASS
jgi:tripartite-type tricarboxylate transporter receptor subunit TctC